MLRSNRLFASMFVLFASTFASSAARADDTPAPKTEPHWYGYQTLAVDGSAALLMATTYKSTVGASIALGTYAIGAPIVHLVHGNFGRGAGSLALRLVLPVAGLLAGGMIGAASGGSGGDLGGAFVGEFNGMMIGLFAGGAVAIAIDAAFLAREDVPVAPKATGFVPWVSPTTGGASAGVAKTF